MSYPQGINFRATSGFVTDGANEYGYTFLDAFNGTYPKTTSQGNTVGFEQGVGNSRDRNSSIDRRLAGVLFGGLADFRFDLPATGSYNVRLAAGDASNATNPTVSLVDGSTVLATLSNGSSTSAGSFRDATNVALTAANWPASNTAYNATFSTTILRFRVASGTSVAHMYVESAGSGSNSLTVTPSGGITFSGTAPKAFGSVKPVSGGVTFSGTAPVVRTNLQSRTITPTGGITISGTSTVVKSKIVTPSGGLHFGGTAATVFFPDTGSTVTHPIRRKRTRIRIY